MKKLLKTIILVLFTIVFLNNNNQAVADTSREPTRCKISNIVFSPTENITKDSEIELIITPGHEDCYKERIEFNFSIIEVNGGLGNFDKTVYQESANFHSNGDPFKLKFKPGDEYCEGEKCQYYIEATTKNKDGFNPLSTYNNGIIRASNTWHSSEYGNLKGLFNVSSINIVKGGQLQFNEGGGKTKFQAISKTEDEVIEPTPGSQCRIAENGIIFTPHGAQNDTPSEPFINKDSQKELKLTVKTIDCKDIKLEISIWDINKSIWNVNEEVEDAAVSGYPKENGEMNIVYIPGDDDCDGKKNGDGYCNYTLRVKAGNKVLHKLKFEEIKNQKDRIGYYCGINGCDKNPWEIKIQDTGTRSGTDQGAQGIQTQQPTYDTNSPCYDKTSQKYKENCYETLAAVPGIGTEQVVNGKKTGRWYIENTRDYQLGDYIQQMFNLALAVLMVLSVIMIVIAGVEYMTVESIYGKSDAKKRITSAVLGLILGLGIFTILNTINPELLEINFGKGIDIAKVNVTIEPDISINNSNLDIIGATKKERDDYLAAAGIYCPKTGGSDAVKKVAESFIGKSTYRLGGKYFNLSLANPTYAGKDIGNSCDINSKTICIDCSGFANLVLYCSGIIKKQYIGSGGTGDMFGGVSSKAAETINNFDKEKGIVNSIKLVPGDLLGKTGKNYGHVGVYIGDGKVIESTPDMNGRSLNQMVTTTKITDRNSYMKKVLRTVNIPSQYK